MDGSLLKTLYVQGMIYMLPSIPGNRVHLVRFGLSPGRSRFPFGIQDGVDVDRRQGIVRKPRTSDVNAIGSLIRPRRRSRAGIVPLLCNPLEHSDRPSMTVDSR